MKLDAMFKLIENQPRSFRLQKLSRFSCEECSPQVPMFFVDSDGHLFGWRGKLGRDGEWVYGVHLKDVLKKLCSTLTALKARG